MFININDLKSLSSKLNLAIEKSKINPKASWIELKTTNESIDFKISNYDYFLEASIKSEEYINDSDMFHVTILAETFIPLISKLDVETVNIYEHMNSLMLETSTSSYTFPIIKELGVTKTLDFISFECTGKCINDIKSEDLTSVANVNTKGLLDALFSRDIQKYIYVDENGAITFTENIYINNFKESYCESFKMLLTVTQAKLLEVFSNEENISLSFENKPTFTNISTLTNKVCIESSNIRLILILQDIHTTNSFPSIKLRTLSENKNQTNVIIDKKSLEKALNRLMIFDKKFDITVMDYSKVIFKENELELVSIKNKNFEKIPYTKSQNTFNHEVIIRFADLIKQLKAITTKEIDISYSMNPAIILNSNVKQLIPTIKLKENV